MLRERINPAAVLLRFALVGMVLGSGACWSKTGTQAAPADNATLEEIARSTLPKCQQTQQEIEDLKPYKKYVDDDKNSLEDCKNAVKLGCDIPPDKTESGTPEKSCVLIYKIIRETIRRSAEEAKADCDRMNSDFTRCKGMQPGGAVQFECLSSVVQTFKTMQDRLADIWMNAQGRLLPTEEFAQGVIHKLRDDRNFFLPFIGPKKTLSCQPVTPIDPIDYHSQIVMDPAKGEGPAIEEHKSALQIGEKFRKFAYSTASTYQQNSAASTEQYKKLDALARRMVTASTEQGPLGPPKNNTGSNITGDTKGSQMPQMGGSPQQSGGGGSPSGGGGSPSGGGAPTNGGGPGGDNYPNPKAGGDPTAKAGGPNDGSGKSDGGARVGNGGPNAKDPFANKGDPKVDKPGGISNRVGLSGFGTSGGELENGKGGGSRQTAGVGGSSKPASGSPSGGGASGGGGGGGKADPNCEGPNCQAMAKDATSSQFAGAGSLGGSPLSLGGLDSPAPLDNLFKSDDSKLGALPPGDAALAGLGTGDLGAGLGPDGSPLPGEGDGQGASEIGARESKDLFIRVSGKLESAQKRGMVAGMTKKL